MKQQPIVAFLYDFDKTLCTTDMQDYAFIPSLGMTPAEFWAEANGFGHRNRMDGGKLHGLRFFLLLLQQENFQIIGHGLPPLLRIS